ncbi:hypothetical protein ACHAXR_011327 [Thalassiosira sp. AJA248-18]
MTPTTCRNGNGFWDLGHGVAYGLGSEWRLRPLGGEDACCVDSCCLIISSCHLFCSQHPRQLSILLSAAAHPRPSSPQNELLRRLITVTETLSTIDETPSTSSPFDPTTHPGLLSLSTTLPTLLQHKDKDVRLHAVLAACEIFYLYAPEPPWEHGEIIAIFGQLIRQLGNLHATPPSSSNFQYYFRILEQLSEVKIGVVLVDLIRTECGSDNGQSALETLSELIRTLLNCVHVDHPPEVASHAEMAVAACMEEFEGSVPLEILEEVLVCVGGGPVCWVTNPAFAALDKKKKKTKGSSGSALPPPQIQQTNPSYLVAAKVLRRTEDKISSPIAALLNGLLTGDPTVVDKTSLSTVDAETAQLLASPKGSGKKKRKSGGSGSAGGTNSSGDKDESPPTLTSHLSTKDATSSGAGNVYSISYELHRIAPQILTTVIGTVSTSLTNPDLTKRWQATKLLGRLFGARSSDIAGRFVVCFREWLRRSYDPEPKVRETMVKCLINFLTTQHSATDLCADVNEALATIIMRDPTLDIRLLGIHQVCDLAHTAVVSGSDGSSTVGGSSGGGISSSSGNNKRGGHPISIISPTLLQAIGSRVSSKNKTEHKDAITGLAQIYHKHYLRKKLRYVQEGGEDVPIDEILDVWKEAREGRKENSVEEEKFAWIPQKVFECVSYPDATDAEMRSRIFQIVDDVLLGTTKNKDAASGSTLSPTSRAVGLALIVDSVKEKDNAYKWMCTLFSQRSRLQKALGAYLDARSKAKECDSGTAEAFAATSDAKAKLELVASLSAPVAESKSPGSPDLEAILKKVHGAKDKHIFRILSTIANATHSPSARVRAFDELPKRTKSLGTAAQSWVKTLARRCAMGAFLNAESIEHCIMLSQECFESEDCQASCGFLECVKLATSAFPSLGSTEEGFKNLVEFFDASRTTTHLSSSLKKEMEKYGMVTMLSEILARSGTGTASSGKKKKSKKGSGDSMDFDEDDADGNKSSYDTLREQLLRLCTRDGTPEQARNSVYTISSMIKPQSQSTPGSGGSSSLAMRVRKEKKEFEPLLKALVNPSRLSIPDESTNPKTRGRIVSILSAVAAIAECAPYAFNASGEGSRLGWGQRALDFCLDTVLLGKNARLNASMEEDDNSDDSDDGELSPAQKGRSKNGKRAKSTSNVLVHCEMLCGAIEVLVAHIRSTVVNSRRGNSTSKKSNDPKISAPSSDHIQEVFQTLVQIIEEDGVPPSSVNGRYCKTAKDKAQLRRSASVNLLRLCDANLRLEADYLTPRMWHILSSALLDSDKTVRSAIMEELLCMFTARGTFRAIGSAQLAPSLRFVSLVTLCADGESGAHLAAANANAANVGQRKSNEAKTAATSCIKQLRTTCQAAQASCRSSGRSAEKEFERRWKMKLMPEYCVPYALHLLAFRSETASAAGTLAGENDDAASDVSSEAEEGKEVVHDQEASQKMLKKRLKWLFDPLIMSLGAGADNISFLLRMVELIGKHPPIDVLQPVTTSSDKMSSLERSLDDSDSDAAANADEGRHSEMEAAARMKIISQFAREVLLSHVKKDVNLTVYPGSIQYPGDLYSRPRPSSTSPVPPGYESEESEAEEQHVVSKKRRAKKSIGDYVKKDRDEMEEDESVEGGKSEGNKSVDDKSEGGRESEEQEKDDSSNSTYEHSPKNSEKSVDNESEKTEEQLTYEPTEQLSPLASPLPPDGDGFDKEFGDVSPIAKADDSPVAETGTARSRGDRMSKRSSVRATSKSKTTSGGKRKRKSSEIEVFDDFPSPAMTDGTAGEPSVSDKAASSSKKRKSSTTPRAPRGSRGGKKKATPASVPVKTVMVNVTNSAASSSSSGTAPAASQKKRSTTKRKAQKKSSTEEVVNKKDDFDFSDSPVKPKARAAVGGRSRKKSAAVTSSEKKAPARKERAPAKAKVSIGKAAARKTKVTANKTSSRRGGGKKAAPVEAAASPSTTSEASSRANIRRSTRRSPRGAAASRG